MDRETEGGTDAHDHRDAKGKIVALIEAEERKGLALRVAIQGRGPGGFQYELGFVEEKDRQSDDSVVEADGFKVFVDKKTVPNLEGSTLDYVEGVHENGFKIDNPNPLWADPVAQKVQEVLDAKINPGVAAQGLARGTDPFTVCGGLRRAAAGSS